MPHVSDSFLQDVFNKEDRSYWHSFIMNILTSYPLPKLSNTLEKQCVKGRAAYVERGCSSAGKKMGYVNKT